MACGNFKLKILALTLTISFLISNFVVIIVDGSKLHPNGGYDVAVALKESVNVSEANRPVYIDNIKSSLVQLSQRMWMETNETFFISSVEIIVPSTWTDLENVLDEPTANNYMNADIRVSEETKYPWVQNPNPCGHSGDFIELPRSFFDSANSGAYGLNSKALLVQWARYRYGAWEEHGFPADPKFPYFYKSEDSHQANQTEHWQPTGCTNSDLVGEYRFINGTPCDETAVDELDSGCRFFPATTGENDDVTSSLMHYHFLESVEHFCNEDTHNKYAPNKQNYFCDFRSVLETIWSSSDFKMLNTSDLSPTVPTLKTKVVRVSKLPSLYILVDHGSVDQPGSAPIINIVTIKLALLLNELSSHQVVASVGSFPTSIQDLNVKKRKDVDDPPLISWRPILGNEDSFADALVPTPVNGPRDRDFGLAIQQAGEAIKKSNPDNGGLIVIFKTGFPTNFSKISYEKSIENYLMRENIKLFSIELGLNRTGGNLESIANKSDGQGVMVRSPNPPDLTNLLTSVRDIFVTPPPPVDTLSSVHPIIVFDEMVEAAGVTKIPVNRGAELLTFHLSTTEANVSPVACVDGHSYCVSDFIKVTEWGEPDDVDVGKRFVHTGLLNLSSITTAQFVSFQYSGNNSPGQLTVSVEGSRLVPVYDISVATTAQDGVVDLSPGLYNIFTPFAIYVKVTQAGKPVVRGIEGVAELKFANGMLVKLIPLTDDGQGGPDVQANDGIYSAIYVPPQNDFYTIRVKIMGTPVMTNDEKKSLSSSARLLPVDQEDIFNGGCGSGNCDTTEPIEAFTTMVNYAGSIQVKNRHLYKTGMPLRIRDLTIHEESSNFEITMEYSAPQLLGEDATPTLYMLYTSMDRNNLTALGPSQWPLPVGVENPKNQTSPQFNPGERVQFNYTSNRDAFTYFAVVAFNKDYYSPISNIVSKAMIVPPPTTTTEDPSLTTAEPTEEDTKSWIKKPAGIITIIAIILVVFIVAGAAFWYFKRKRAARNITTRP